MFLFFSPGGEKPLTREISRIESFRVSFVFDSISERDLFLAVRLFGAFAREGLGLGFTGVDLSSGMAVSSIMLVENC